MARQSFTCPKCRIRFATKHDGPISERQPVVCPACKHRLSGDSGQQRSPQRPPQRMPLMLIAIVGAVCFVALTAVLAVVLFVFLRKPTDQQPQASAPPPSVQPAAGKVVTQNFAGPNRSGPDESPEAPLVYLFCSPKPTTEGGVRGTLMREIYRQGLLLTARESFGLATRDNMLREEPPKDLLPANTLVLFPIFTVKGRTSFELQQMVKSGPPNLLLAKQLDPPQNEPRELNDALEVAERFSRSEFVDALRKAGFRPKAALNNTSAKISPETETLLSEMRFTSQFATVRDLHATIRTRGESPWLIGALSRAYAHLGILCECQWSSAHKVFKARALLYAQRLVAAGGDSPIWGLWHRAYAEALAGMHASALADLARTDGKKPAAGPGSDRTPEWVGLISPLCHFDAAALQIAARRPELRQLALLLRFMALESDMTAVLTLAVGDEALAANPECFRIHETVAEVGGVANRHHTTVAGMEVFARTFPRRLAEMHGLPPAVSALLAKDANEPAVVKALTTPGSMSADLNEPSWGVLGQWARETRFGQVWRRLAFMRDMWSVPVGEFLSENRPLVADHPCIAFIDSFALDRRHDLDAYMKLIKKVPVVDFDFRHNELLRSYRSDEIRSRELFVTSVANSDWSYHDYMLVLRNMQRDAGRLKRINDLLRISEFAPPARTAIVEQDWVRAAPNAAAWEKDCQHPHFLLYLGRKYTELDRLDDAARCLKRAVELSPDLMAYLALGAIYKKRGQTDEWVATLEKVLKEPDPGLSHAQVRVELANHFMDQKDFKRALPYAEAAAETGAGWAMLCAAECHEGLKHWDEAEEWVRNECERYPGDATRWLAWCARTGKGDAASAARLALAYFERLGERMTPAERTGQCLYLIFAGDHARAAAALAVEFERSKSEHLGWLALLEYDRLGDVKKRDAVLKVLLAQKNPQRAKAFQGWLARGEKPTINAADIDALLQSTDERDRGSVCYMVGRFLVQHGQRDKGIEYLKRAGAANLAAKRENEVLLAVVELRSLKVDPGPLAVPPRVELK